MKFGLASALVFGCLLTGGDAVAQSPSATPAPPKEQSIIFSSPDGTEVSNALLPAAQAPQPLDGLSDMSGNQATINFAPQLPGPRYPRPLRMTLSRDKSRNSDDPYEILRSPSSREIMGVPTLEEIFGLPKSSTNGQNQARMNGSSTNLLSSDGSPSDSPSWSQMLANENGFNNYNYNNYGSDSAPGSDTNSASMTGSYFNNAFSDSVFDDRNKSAGDSTFGAPIFDQTTSPQSGSDPSASAPSSASSSSFSGDATSFAPKTPTFSSAFNTEVSPQSPFSFPHSAPATMPELPTAPVFQNPYGNYSPAASSGWQPQAPWMNPVPPLGTMTPRKF